MRRVSERVVHVLFMPSQHAVPGLTSSRQIPASAAPACESAQRDILKAPLFQRVVGSVTACRAIGAPARHVTRMSSRIQCGVDVDDITVTGGAGDAGLGTAVISSDSELTQARDR